MKTDELREKYLEFFQSKGHTRKPSDVLVPRWDPSVLFTPAGMNPFKDHFLGKVKLEFTRATTCQKCLRTGDIDNVGRTAYHHTFFEMLGNFSFGDYFKREAIHWAWEFLTDKKWLAINPEHLTVTVYLDDDEAANIWNNEIGLPVSRIERMGEDDNFWPASAPSQGPDGVCGPCSEIYYKPPGKKSVEIWNLVFTQFNRVGEPPNNLRPLPSKNIDTGMGLERIASVLQGVDTNYHIDILRPLVEAAAEVCGQKYEPGSDNGRRLRRIADHVRACTFAVHENVLPGPNRERYVIRRLLRRAVLDGYQMGLRGPFLHQLVPMVAQMMKNPYPELSETIERVQKGIIAEENTFFGTVGEGLARINRMFDDMKAHDRVLVNGSDSAELYQTYGVPPEMVEQMASELSFTFDWDGFKASMAEHATTSGKLADVVFKKGPIESLKEVLKLTKFLGYESTEAEAHVQGIVQQDTLKDSLEATGEEQTAIVVLDQSPFYGEAGGQVGDQGELVGKGVRFVVTDTKKDADLLLHHGYVAEGKLQSGMKLTAKVGSDRRNAIRRAHSATHILQYALQKTLGKDCHQLGSKVQEDELRFDFGNPAPVDQTQLATIEGDVAAKISAAAPIEWKFVPLNEARTAGAMMLFGEKYPDPARMVSIGDFSKELCAGTHLDNTRDVGDFEVVAEEGVAAGTRRIVAFTGSKAKEYVAQTSAAVDELCKLLGTQESELVSSVKTVIQQVRDLRKQLASGGKPSGTPTEPMKAKGTKVSAHERKQVLRDVARGLNVGLFEAPQRIAALQAEVHDLQKQIADRAKSGSLSADTLLAAGQKVNDVTVIVAEAAGVNSNLMRQLIDQIRKQTGSSAVLLAAAEGDDKVVIVAGFSRDLVDRGLSAGNWVSEVAPVVGGKGGGKPDLAQAGGKHPEKLSDALAKAREVVAALLSSAK